MTRLIAELEAGSPTALDELFPLVYDEIHALARRHRRRWQGNETLDTTALVHEAYLKLVDQERVSVESRAHFLALAARAMRHILCNYARARGARKRGGDAEIVPFDELDGPPLHGAADGPPLQGAADGLPPHGVTDGPDRDLLLALDHALERLAEVDPRGARVVECRFFGGLTVDETAAALDVSPRTVKRDWAFAQAWLHRELGGRR